jgi:hypothetical protein
MQISILCCHIAFNCNDLNQMCKIILWIHIFYVIQLWDMNCGAKKSMQTAWVTKVLCFFRLHNLYLYHELCTRKHKKNRLTHNMTLKYISNYGINFFYFKYYQTKYFCYISGIRDLEFSLQNCWYGKTVLYK